jgi:hypothetical protein
MELDEGEAGHAATEMADASHAMEEWKTAGWKGDLAVGAGENGDEDEDGEEEEPEKKVLTVRR